MDVKMTMSAEAMLEMSYAVARSITLEPVERDELGNDRIIPVELRRWLARLRLLEGVPFANLVPDSDLLPPESIRFFYLDRRFTDALVQGALSVGTANAADRVQLEAIHAPVRDEIDAEERYVRLPGGDPPPDRVSPTITGFLLRSRAVSGWPGLHVRAYGPGFHAPSEDAIIAEDEPHRLHLLRLERLAPAVLLALFDGVPTFVHVEEPRQGIQFGVRFVSVDDPAHLAPFIPVRDGTTGLDLRTPDETVDVPCRPGSPGVLDMRHLDARLRDHDRANMGDEVDSGENALQLLRFPYRQVFGNPPGNDLVHHDQFRPTVSLDTLKAVFAKAVQP